MTTPDSRHALGRRLVAMQFALMALLGGLAIQGAATAPVPLWAWLLAAASAAVGAAALAANRPGNFNIHPAPRAGGRLVTAGIYRHVRHPMYTAVLCAGAAAAGAAAPGPATWLAGAAWAALAATLWAKSGLEERWLAGHHPGYATYAATTHRFVPGLL